MKESERLQHDADWLHSCAAYYEQFARDNRERAHALEEQAAAARKLEHKPWLDYSSGVNLGIAKLLGCVPKE